MNFFERLFNNPANTDHLAQCPRCLGKGYVDMDDIKRLKNELKWRPGKCAYCNGKGKVEPALITKVAADEAYLTVDESKRERDLFMEGDPAAVRRGELYKENVDRWIHQIKEMYFEECMSVEEIVAAILQGRPGVGDKEVKELLVYVQKVIDSATKN
ncbi:hypothetical protein [[Flexibacter] sp. ATCC 35208]|uniref:hypothetical protein n=1 Tax=[Flexibacter] sp. ATCC 35208 TaxID=1936242 RepID=UPI0009CF2F5E|nr:hypothetical protein [[Flexibacter] sp. ATCC 35208]OMP76750.1 hypothetical protein BW716_23435 [[Flexibacter] sp. ATCC 35208]